MLTIPKIIAVNINKFLICIYVVLQTVTYCGTLSSTFAHDPTIQSLFAAYSPLLSPIAITCYVLFQ